MGNENDDAPFEPGAEFDSGGVYGRITMSADDDVTTAVMRDRHELAIDEPGADASSDWSEWLSIGEDAAPCPADYLLLAVAGCQVSVLRQCFAKARIDEYEIEAHVESTNYVGGESKDPMPAHTALRMKEIRIDLDVETAEEYADRIQRCLDIAEDMCIMSRSVEAGIDVELDTSLSVS